MKKNYLLGLILLISSLGFSLQNKSFGQIVISGYLANSAGTDSPYEYVQCVATQNINFTTNNYCVVWTNNGTATSNGWIVGGAVSYGFNLTSGSVTAGQTFYVGGSGKFINGVSSTDISSENWIKTINTGTTVGDGFGTAASGGVLGNGGANADGIGVFSGQTSSLTNSSIPIDAVFFGTGVGSAKPTTGGYVLPTNDKYINSQGTFGNGTNTFLFPDPASGGFTKLSGTFNTSTNLWTTSRTASTVTLTVTSSVSAIASGITLTVPSTPTITTTGTLTSVNTIYGTPSTTPTSLTVSGSNLTNDILITPPSGYEVSKTVGGTSGYANTQTLNQTSGTVPSTTIYVRLKADATVAGSPYAGNIGLSSTGATSVNVATVSSTVSAKALTITGITADNKVYDATTTASFSGTPAYSGLENAETFSVTGTATASFETASIGNAKTVSVTGYTAPSTNYSVTQPSLSANLTPAILTITSAMASNKVYDGNNSTTVTGTLSGVLGSEIVTLNPSGTFSQTSIGTALTVTSTSIIGGVDAGNYTLTQPTGLTADITAKPLTITGLTANNKVFDGNSTATLSGTATLNGVVSGEEANVTLTGTPTATFAQSAVGAGIVVTVTGYSLTGLGSGNYTVSQPSGLTADITNSPSPVINSALTATAIYGEVSTSYFITATNSPTSYNVTGLPTGLIVNTTTGEISGTPTEVTGSPFSVTISATNNGGTGMATLVYTIIPKALTITDPSVPNKVYDRTNAAAIAGTLTGIVGTDVVTLSGTGTFSQATVGNGLAVTSTSTLDGADAAKYSLTQPSGLMGEIVIKPITVSGATASNKVYDGNSTATLTGATLNGIISPDVVTLTGGATFASVDVANNITINTSSLTLGGADAGNYIALPIIGLTANITGKPLTISGLSSINKIYDGNATATLSGTATLNGTVGTDDVSLLGTAIADFNNKNIGTAKPITVSGYTLSGTKSGNYSVTQPTGLSADITSLALTVNNPVAQNKVFDGNTNATITGTLSGVISPDVVTFIGTGTFASSAAGTGIAVTSTSTLGGADVGNYTLTQPTGLTANIDGPPTIAMDVSTTSNYVDGGITTSPAGSFATSGVINDPTDPAKNFGIDFTIADAETGVGSLTVSATSSNLTVLPSANLNLTGTGASRNLKITPNAEGLSNITVTVNDGVTTSSFTINYASSLSSTNVSTTRFHTGTADASTAQMIDNNLMIVADDENQALRMYDRNNSGLPINSFDFTSSLGLTDISGGNPREVDIEASSKVGNRIYWMGSHSNASSGNNRPNRSRFFATDISGTGNATTLSYIGRYDNLKTELLAWDANNGHGLGANFLGLTVSSSRGKAPEIADGSGFNIEGFEIAPNNTTAYICFRAPLQTTTTRTKALIIPLTNFADLVSGNPTATTATFGTPIQLDLGGRAIREMKKNGAGEYLIMAGPHDVSTGIAPKDFRFYTWTGNPMDAPILRSANLTALNSNGSFESIVDLPSPLLSTSNLQVLVDNGDAIFYGNGLIAKELPQNNHKKFRSEIINLGTEILPLVTIKSITTGNWESTTTWDLGRIPQAGDLVIIDQNHEVTLNGNGKAKKIEYQGTGKIIFSSTVSTLNTGL